MKSPCAIVWFRNDLRLDDHTALAQAATQATTILPLFIWAPEEEAPWEPGSAARVWLHHSLTALAAELERLGQNLILGQGPSADALIALARACHADTVFWNTCWEPAARRRDAAVAARLQAAGITATPCRSGLLCEPDQLRNKQGKPFQVFTPFWRQVMASGTIPSPIDRPRRLPPPPSPPVSSLALEELALRPQIPWDQGVMKAWTPGAAAARRRLDAFVRGPIEGYQDGRDRPDQTWTSQLSPHLHAGEISAARIWHEVLNSPRLQRDGAAAAQADAFLRQLCWREFAHHLLHHFPHTTEQPLHAAFADFPWVENQPHLRAWQQGRTGFPIVDAGMRALWHTGTMHNRVRLIAASFLTKDLLLPWQAGARWFWDTLVDADLANNTLGWQWTAGCGADAAPYFRIFNPVTQAQRFDPDGAYVRRWIPALARLENRWIHCPWEAPAEALATAGVRLDQDYPRPIVDHAAARLRALRAYDRIKRR